MAKQNRQKVIDKRWAKKEETGRVVKEAHKSEVKPPVQAKNEKQKEFLKVLNTKQVAVATAPAGFGKSYLVMSEVTDWLKKGYIDKIIFCRPSVGMGTTLGLLPGDMRQKYEPFLLPLVDVVCERYGRGFYESCLANGTIEFQPLEYIRGRSFNCVVVLEEAQNTKPDEMYTVLTRVGEGGKLICIGDATQTDIRGENGIQWLEGFVQRHSLDSMVGVVKATSDDIVRSGLCKTIVKAKEKDRGEI